MEGLHWEAIGVISTIIIAIATAIYRQRWRKRKKVLENRRIDARGNTGAVASGDHSTAIVDNSTTYNVTHAPASQAVVTDPTGMLTEEQKKALFLLKEKGWVNARYLQSDGLSRRVLETLVNLGYVTARVEKLLRGPDRIHYGLTDRGARVVEMLRDDGESH